jgi:hypothetical protein
MKPIVAAPIVALALAGAGTGVYFVATSGGEEETLVVQPTPTAEPTVEATPTPTPDKTRTVTPAPTSGPSVDDPATWATYEDPKGRFSIRVPPEWEMSQYSTADNPQWLELGESQVTDGHLTDGVKLSVDIQSRDGRSLADLAATPPDEGLYPRLSQVFVTVNGQEALYLTRGLDAKIPSQVTYVFERDADFLAVTIYTGGPKAPEYISLFESILIKSFIVQ